MHCRIDEHPAELAGVLFTLGDCDATDQVLVALGQPDTASSFVIEHILSDRLCDVCFEAQPETTQRLVDEAVQRDYATEVPASKLVANLDVRDVFWRGRRDYSPGCPLLCLVHDVGSFAHFPSMLL